MPLLFSLALAFFAIGIIAVFIALITREPGPTAFAIGFIVLGGLFTLFSSMNSVPIRSVGIVTSYGKPTGEVTGSGFKMVKPWEKVGEWDASRQRYDHSQDKNAIPVRTGTLAIARVNVLIEWQVKPEKAPEQFLAYKGDFETFKNQKVGIQLDGAMNDAFADYNPLQNIDTKTGNLNVDLKPYADKAKSFATQRLGNDVDILSVTIIRVNHDDKTEANIKAFQDKLAMGRNLEQDEINAKKQKTITETNAQVDKVMRCLEIADKNGTDPGLCINPGIVLGSKK